MIGEFQLVIFENNDFEKREQKFHFFEVFELRWFSSSFLRIRSRRVRLIGEIQRVISERNLILNTEKNENQQ